MSDFLHVGQRVVCIGCEGTPKPPGHWEWWIKKWNVTLPVRGSSYTIRDIRVSKSGLIFVRLVEIKNPEAKFCDAPDQEPWFFAKAFRPIHPRNTDISVFTDMLKTVGKPLEVVG